MLHSPNLAQAPHRRVVFDVDVAGADGAGRPQRRRIWRILVWTGGILALLIAALAAFLAVAIGQSIELGFLRTQVDTAIERALGEGYRAEVGSAVLAVDPVIGLVVRLSEISISDSLDQEVARIPSAMLGVSLLAIVTPEAMIRSIEIDNARFAIRRDGGEAFLGNAMTPSVAATPGEAAEPGAFPAGFDILAGPLEALDKTLEDVLALAGRGFESIGIYNATIELWRSGGTEPHRFERADLGIEADAETGNLAATMTASGYSGRWSVSAERIVNPVSGGRMLTLRFSQLTLADFFPAVGGEPSAIATNIPFYGRVMVGIDASGEVTGANGRFNLGSGYFAFGPAAAPINVEEATVQLIWNAASEEIVVMPSRFVIGGGHATIAGVVRPDGAGRFAFDLESTDAVLAPRDSPSPPLAVNRIRLAGAIDLNAGLLNFDRAAIVTGAGSLVAAGSIGLEPGGPSIALAATLSEMPISVFKQLWPPGLQDGGRLWTLDNVTAGMISGTLEAAIPAGTFGPGGRLTPDMLHLELALRDVSFRTFPYFPSVTHASGRAVLAGNHFAVDLDSGQIPAPNGHVLELLAATFVVSDMGVAVPTGHVELHVAGGARAFGAIAEADPIRALGQFGVTADALHGAGTARMSANWPLLLDLSIEEVDWRIALTVNGLASDTPFNNMRIRNGDVLLEITPEVVNVTGTAEVDGVRANLDLAFPMVGEIDGRQQLRMVLDEEARARLGFHLEGLLGGTVRAIVTDLGPAGPGQHYDLDLEQARIVLAPFGWAKPIGVPATMSFDLLPVEGGFHIRGLRLEGDGFGFNAEVDLDAGMAIVRAVVSDFRLRRADSLGFTIERDGNGWAIEARGAAFDARGLIAAGLGEGDTTGEFMDLRVHARFDQLIGFNGERIANAEVTFLSRGGVVQQLDVSGTLQGLPVTATFGDSGAGRRLSVYVGNAGALLRFANRYSNAQGGEMIVNGATLPDGALYGELTITGFTISNEPFLTQLMTQPEGESPAAPPTTVPFELLEFDFIQRGTVITLNEILLRGGELGAIGAGWIDFAAGQMAIGGTYIPAYTVNNIFGRIPIIGLALGGGRNEGLFGITFQIAGPIDNLVMRINPLSAIAPGIFRKIFQFQ